MRLDDITTDERHDETTRAVKAERWRLFGLLSVLYFAQGLPSGLIAKALPPLLRQHGVSLSIIGFTSALALPWALKFAWAPFVDRYGTRKRWLLALNGTTFVLMLVIASRDFAAWVAIMPLLLAVLFLMNRRLRDTGHRHGRICRHPLADRVARSRQQHPGRRLQGRHGGWQRRTAVADRALRLAVELRRARVPDAARDRAGGIDARLTCRRSTRGDARAVARRARLCAPAQRVHRAPANGLVAADGRALQVRRLARVADDRPATDRQWFLAVADRRDHRIGSDECRNFGGFRGWCDARARGARPGAAGASESCRRWGSPAIY